MSPAFQADSLLSEPPGKPRILEWVAYPFSNESFWPSNQTGVSLWRILYLPLHTLVFPGGSDGKQSTYNEGDPDLIPGL